MVCAWYIYISHAVLLLAFIDVFMFISWISWLLSVRWVCVCRPSFKENGATAKTIVNETKQKYLVYLVMEFIKWTREIAEKWTFLFSRSPTRFFLYRTYNSNIIWSSLYTQLVYHECRHVNWIELNTLILFLWSFNRLTLCVTAYERKMLQMNFIENAIAFLCVVRPLNTTVPSNLSMILNSRREYIFKIQNPLSVTNSEREIQIKSFITLSGFKHRVTKSFSQIR